MRASLHYSSPREFAALNQSPIPIYSATASLTCRQSRTARRADPCAPSAQDAQHLAFLKRRVTPGPPTAFPEFAAPELTPRALVRARLLVTKRARWRAFPPAACALPTLARRRAA